MEERDRSRSPSRRTSRVEQVVGRWLRRSRDLGSRSHSLTRERVSADGKTVESSVSDQRNHPFRFTVRIQREPGLTSHGFTLSRQTPILVQVITPGGPADGRLVPGDRLVKINNVAVDDLTPEQAAEIIRECQDTVTVTVLRILVGPKSSFITPEKRAKLRSNPVKVRFAEEVEVNGHSQGNSLLFLPNVLKVYLENGQTKAFKFEPNTTVKDIVMTLKEKLSLVRIENFSLVLEQQYSITKLLLLHEEERIQQVVQKREAHDYRCLFRVCFMPRDPRDLLLDDPTAFEYFYLQGVNDVLQERFAVEMRCNTALRLAALQIQERLASCGQSHKTNLKIITKTWGIENFVSCTLLRNMREKDLKKAIGYHMKKIQSQQDPKQKGVSANQARINYLEELGELKSFGGKSFSATMMLQDRESMVTLLVGARYGVSQVVNHKLSIMTKLTEFTNITRIELLPESDKVSLVKIYLQDIKPITLLLESVAAKDLSCLIAGYCHVCVDPNLNIFPWTDDSKKHKVSTEEGYVSRCGSDSDSSDMDALATLVSRDVKPRPRIRSSSDPDGRKRKDKRDRRQKELSVVAKGGKPKKETNEKEEKDKDTEKEKSPPSKDTENKRREEGDSKGKVEEENGTKTERVEDTGQIQIKVTDNDSGGEQEKGSSEKEGGGGEDGARGEREETPYTVEEQPSLSETSDSFRFLTSQSSDSLDALEEDDLISCSSSLRPKTDSYPQTHLHPYCPQQLHLYPPTPPHSPTGYRRSGDGADPHLLSSSSSSTTLNPNERPTIDPSLDDKVLCFVELSRLVDYLPSPPEASDEEDDAEEELRRRRRMEVDESIWAVGEGGEESTSEEVGLTQRRPSASPCSSSSRMDFVFNFDQQSDARCYYKLCTNVTPDSARSLSEAVPHTEGEANDGVEVDDCRDKAVDPEPVTILQPPPGFGDSSSDEEFFDARDRFASPEDPTSGAVPRDFAAEMKPDHPRTLSLSDIGISVSGTEKEAKDEGGSVRDEEEGGGRETLFQLRRRSRKRRSFMETGFTSTVSFPEPGIDSNQDPVSNRIHKNLLAQTVDRQLLSSPESSGQTQNPCPTVSSLSRSEGEPAQLESKPIWSKPRPHGPAPQTGDGDPRPSPRVKQQDMEMEPDAMESKSVTDSVKEAPCPITAVRCRVEPDGKESADRRGDGKEEGEKEEDVGEKKEDEEEEDGEKEEVTAVSWNGPLTTHMFLADIVEEESRGEEAEEEEKKEEEKRRPVPSSELRPLVCFEREMRERVHVVDERVDNRIKRPSHSPPPPPPPTSPLPPLPLVSKSLNDHSMRGDGGTPTRMSISICSDGPDQHIGKDNYTNNEQIHVEVKTNHEDETISVFGSVTTNSDDVVYSANSDNVFEDHYEVDNSLHSSLSDSTAKDSIRVNTNANTNTHSDYADTVNYVTTKAVPATNVAVPTFNANVTVNKLPTIVISSSNSTTITKSTTNAVTPPIIDTASNVISTMAEATHEGKLDMYNTSLAKANIATVHDVSKEYQSPTHFLFQSCSPGIMGRLSTSTIRDKIQRLPLYLPRSQEAFNQSGIGNVAQSPSPEFMIDDTEITVKLTHNDDDDINQTKDTEMSTVSESAESDDSDSTVTGSDVEGDGVVEAASAEITRSTMSEVKETFEKVVMQGSDSWRQPEHHTEPLYSGLNKDTPGPIIKPPSYRTGQSLDLKMFTSGSKMDVPGPIREAPESKMKAISPKSDVPGSKISIPSPSIPPPIVVTTQNLNRPGLPFLSDSERQCRTSSDRLTLTRLCRPAGENSDSFERQSTGCGVFTTCKDQPQTKTPAQLGPTLKPDYGCSSVLAAGCESVMEGVQVPLDACGCPEVYTNCLSKGDSFDDELTVYEFSCHTQSSGVTQTSGMGLPLMTAPCVPSFLSTSPPTFPSSSLSPSFPRSTLFSASNSELSPLLSPLSEASDCYPSRTHKDTISHLRVRRYPAPPAGFQTLRSDVDQLLSVLDGLGGGASVRGRGGRHPRDTCPAHFTENKRVLHTEARRLMAGCQKVVGVGQSPEDMLFCLADSFRTLVELAGVCLWFSGCDRCDRRNAEAIAGLIDVARSFTDFCLAAERASGKRSCQDLSTKLLAKQCTALTASVFCLTQLFRTLTAL